MPSSRRAVLASSLSLIAGCSGFRDRPTAETNLAGAWTQVGGNSAHSGHQPDSEIPNEPNRRWRTDRSARPTAMPLTDRGRVFTATPTGVARYDTESGEVRWSVSNEAETWATPAVGRGRVHVPQTDAGVEGVTAADATPALRTCETGEGGADWERALRGKWAFAPTATMETVFVQTDRTAYALDAETGAVDWRYDGLTPPPRDAFHVRKDVTPAVAGDAVAFPSGESVVALDRESGERRWQSAVGGVASAPVYDGDALVVASLRGLERIDPGDGTTLWKRTGTFRNTPAVGDDTVYVTDVDGMAAYRKSDGEQRWSRDFGETWASPAVLADTVVGCSTEETVAVRKGDGEVRWRRSTGSYSALAVGKAGLFVTAHSPEFGRERLVAFGPE
jgi:outer membrane protein assembly factor BamB